jgi:hypothetical protein
MLLSSWYKLMEGFRCIWPDNSWFSNKKHMLIRCFQKTFTPITLPNQQLPWSNKNLEQVQAQGPCELKYLGSRDLWILLVVFCARPAFLSARRWRIFANRQLMWTCSRVQPMAINKIMNEATLFQQLNHHHRNHHYINEIIRKQTTIWSNVGKCQYLCGAVCLFSAPSDAHSVWQTVKSTIENVKVFETQYFEILDFPQAPPLIL